MLKVHNCEFIISAVEEAGYPEADRFEVTLLGRSNVGKSTFINKFCKRKNLVFTSSKPGKTVTLNFFNVNEDLRFVDVPGYGYAKVSKKQREEFGKMIEEYLVTRTTLKLAILLVDFKVGPTEDDLLMYQFLKFHEIPVLIIATKKDKVKNSIQHKTQVAILEKLQLSEEDTFYAYSAESNKDMEKIHDIVEGLLK